MANLNRIKCSASIDATGNIVFGAVVAGFVAMPTAPDGEYNYLLESGTDWELGWMRIVAGLCTVRTAFSSSVGTFPISTTGYYFSLVALDMQAVGCLRKSGADVPPRMYNGGIAIGDDSRAGITTADDFNIAVGRSSMASSIGTIALGRSTFVDGDDALTIGSNAKARGLSAVCVGANAVAGDVNTPLSGNFATVVGDSALAHAGRATALGSGAVAFYGSEVALGGSTCATVHHLPIWVYADNTTGTVGVEADAENTTVIDFGSWNAADLARGNVFLRVQGTMHVNDDVNTGLAAYSKILTVDYYVRVSDLGVASLLGTAPVTAAYTGGTPPNSTVTVDATTCAPKLASTYAGGVTLNGLLTVTYITP